MICKVNLFDLLCIAITKAIAPHGGAKCANINNNWINNKTI